MKKILLLFLLLGFFGNAISQSKSITIDWENALDSKVSTFQKASKSILNTKSKAVEGNKTSKQKAFSKLNLSLTKEQQKNFTQWEDSNFANPSSLKVTNITYSNATQEELNMVTFNDIPTSVKSSIFSHKGRNTIYTVFEISPLVKVNGQVKRVTSFKVNYTYDGGNRNSNSRAALTNSVLATGNWYKFKVVETGVHRITQSFLENLGINTASVDPRTIKIYSHGGKSLPLLNSANDGLFDMPQNAIKVVGEQDGSFDSGDAILFYGTSTIGYDEQNDSHINPYSDDSYYYITTGGANGLRIGTMNEPATAATTITTFNDYQFHEQNEFSPAKVGRKLVGNRFDIEDDQTFELNFPNIVSGSLMDVKVTVASASESVTSFALSVNGTALNPQTFGTLSGQFLLNTREFEESVPASGESVTLNLLYNNGGNPSSAGFLDYIRVGAIRQLSQVDGQFGFRYNNAATLPGAGEFVISNASAVSEVWDVTNTGAIVSKVNTDAVSNFSFKAQLGSVREYVAVVNTDFLTPVSIGDPIVNNQDIKGLIFRNASGEFEDVDYLIVTAPFMLQPALRLADHHRQVRGLNVKVVTTDKIYEEFSSGKQDIVAIRNLVRYIYDNASSPDKQIKYVGIIGDTSVDYKGTYITTGNDNIVPTYHTLLSENTFSHFMSDDFFGIMDPEEGMMQNSEKADVALGRILADDVILANEMIDKIIAYESKASYGNWRNAIVMISDDADDNSDSDLQFTLNDLADQISTSKPFINVKKIHTDAFEQQTSAGGNRYPQVNDLIKNDFEVGALILNYFGHGGEDGLSKEFIFTKETANTLKNQNRYPMVITVTCEFTKFDLPTRVTAGELTFWNKEGGAISLITTTRSITVSTGSALNVALADEIFGVGQNLPEPPAIGLRKAKNELANFDRRVVFYIGDPAMPLAFPKPDIKLTSINDQPISSSSEVLQGLDYVKMGGQVTTATGALLSSYNGVVEVKIFDKEVARQTLGNDGVTDGANNLILLDFNTLGEVLFNGQATVVNGEFEFDFVVPQDVQIPVGNGKVSFYAQQNNTLLDNNGYNLDIQVGGLNENAGTDTTGPIIELFMNDENFVNGGITNDSPNFIVKLEDGSGINTASGIGHDLVAILDGDEANPFKLNDYYQASVDDYTKGTAAYRLRDLEDGLHTISFKAWDTYNNSSTAELQFVVSGGDGLTIERVLNYPNPFVNYTDFWFTHNRNGESFLDVQVQVFTVTGKVVWSEQGTYPTNGSNLFKDQITWDGRDDFGDKIGKGVYVYKITVKSPLTNQQTEKFEKLVIL